MFIKESICISPQPTFPSQFAASTLTEHQGNKYYALEPPYEGLIHPGALRRMGKAVKMGVAAGTYLLKNTGPTDGIIIGTANGGLEDCIKFLNQIVDYDEGTLTPTNFVQSTPNALAGQLALIHSNHGYNITHAHGGLSFENAIMDATLLFEQAEADRLLVGCVEEISEYNHAIDLASGLFKKEMTTSHSLLSSETKGTVNGEGAALFFLERTPSRHHQTRIKDLASISYLAPKQLIPYWDAFLERQGLEKDEIGALILGYNGDYDSRFWYDQVRSQLPESTPVFSFKNACGEYPTAAGFAVWLGQQILENKPVPEELMLGGQKNGDIRKVVIYNHYRQIQHSFILLDTYRSA